jgi:hypothetical protein
MSALPISQRALLTTRRNPTQAARIPLRIPPACTDSLWGRHFNEKAHNFRLQSRAG